MSFFFLRHLPLRSVRSVVVIAVALMGFGGSAAWQTTTRSKVAMKTAASGKQEARIEKIEAVVTDISLGDKEAPLRLSLAEAMKTYNVPGLSVAVIEDFKIIWAKAYGTIGSDNKTPVNTKTLFQAGSISKPVAATGALVLVQQGQLSLDKNVNEILKSWKLPDNEFTKEQKVTLRRLMSHTAGTTVHGFPGYDIDEPVPVVVQVLNGEKPANTEPVRVEYVPGTKEQYSGGGITIEQLMMTDVTGKKFPALMQETVLGEIGMNDSSYEQPLPAARAALTANGTASDGTPIHGRWHVYPEMAAAGLWTTPTDLAKFGIEIAQSRNGKSNKVLTQKTVEEMLTPVMDEAGLGFFVDKNTLGQFGHSGADEGFQAILRMNWQTGKGIAIMANSDNGIDVAILFLRSVAKEYGWSQKGASQSEQLLTIAKVKGVQLALSRYAELTKSGAIPEKDAERDLNQLGNRLLYGGKEKDAVAVFQQNLHDYPQSANAYDSLGAAYAKTGQKALAVENYKKSLELNPKNENAVKKLKELTENK
jgi:CubicO group peptidase (beta-lactamase class C family)